MTSKSRKQQYRRERLDHSGNSQTRDAEQNVLRHIAQGRRFRCRAWQADGCSGGQQQGTEARRCQQWSSRLDSASQEPRRLPRLHEEQSQRGQRDWQKQQCERTSEDQPDDADDEATPRRRCE